LAASTLRCVRDTGEPAAGADKDVWGRKALDNAGIKTGAVDGSPIDDAQNMSPMLSQLHPRDVLVPSRRVAEQLFARLEGGRLARLVAIELSDRECLVLRHLASGLDVKAIAGSAHMSLRTVKRAIASLEMKFEAPNRFVLAVRATRLGYLG
jgi:DNA-binding CsgD family transcriptional regulator